MDHIFDGLFGGFWGIIAGPTGICLSKLNNLSQTQCLWKVYITFIFFTMMGSIVGFALNFVVITPRVITISTASGPLTASDPEKSDSRIASESAYTALSYIQLILLIGKDSYLNFLIKRNFSPCDRFVLGFLELRLFKMPAQSIIRGSFRANPSRKSYRCSKEQ